MLATMMCALIGRLVLVMAYSVLLTWIPLQLPLTVDLSIMTCLISRVVCRPSRGRLGVGLCDPN